MQFHQGSRLKKKIELSHLKVKEISGKSGVPTSSLHDMYKKPELLKSKIEPILKVLEISVDDFYEINTQASNMVNEPETSYGLKAMYQALQSENEALKGQIEVLKEMVELLKSKKK